MWAARWKLVSLWLSQFSRVTADNALRLFVYYQYALLGDAQRDSGWYLVTAIFIWPSILLAPFNGALCNTLPKPTLLKSLAVFGVFVTAAFYFINDHWLLCWALVSLGSTVYGPTRYAMLPAASTDTHWPLSRINGFVEMGVAAAIIGGMSLVPGLQNLHGSDRGLAEVIKIVVLLNGVALIAALPVSFPSDVRRDEGAMQALRGFVSDLRVVLASHDARVCLLGLSGLRGLIIGMSAVFLARVFGLDAISESIYIAIWIAVGTGAGSLLAGLQRHPRRVLGFVPVGGLGMTIALLVTVLNDAEGTLPGVALFVTFGVMIGLVNVPLAVVYQIALPPDARGNGMAIRNMTDYLFTAATAISMFLLTRFAGATQTNQLSIITTVSAIATVAAFWEFRRELVEVIIEFLFAIMYRFRAAGPGLDTFPQRGPVLVVCNHASWLDPMWLAKVLPRTMIPMMNSIYFDHWTIRWIMIYLFDAIRVQESGFRREVPELKAAVAALDAGKCVVLFPEGRLRRTEELPLRMFGQGVWHILRERPETPVVICWIEGGWGSFFSYWHGSPTKNKRIDIARPVRIGVGEPQVLSADILADHRTTRQFLMEQCLAARQYLGLEPFASPAAVEEIAKDV
ncbi:MAG TPA: MFS transporter [Gemmataceae bacterium]|nr:MFS transporter [Gemmataceae bacterium]